MKITEMPPNSVFLLPVLCLIVPIYSRGFFGIPGRILPFFSLKTFG